MNTEDKLRIEKEARDYALTRGYAGGVQIKWCEKDYIAGSTAEHERMTDELNTKQHLVNVYKIQAKAANERLNQERNKAIDECIELILNAPQTHQWREDAKETVKNKLLALKLKSE